MSPGTAAGFCGMNTVSSGLSASSYKLADEAAELSLSRNLGLVVQGMRAAKDQFRLDMGGAGRGSAVPWALTPRWWPHGGSSRI